MTKEEKNPLHALCHKRLNQMFDQSNQTYSSLANATGVHRHTVQTVFATGRGDMSLIIEIVNLLGHNPADLFDTNPGSLQQILTGVRRIDVMLRKIYSETYSISGGGEAMEPYIAPDYYCVYTGYQTEVRSEYQKYFQPVPPSIDRIWIDGNGDKTKIEQGEVIGLTYQAERKLNARSAAATKSVFSKKLCDVAMCPMGISVHYSIAERSQHDDKVVIRNMHDSLQLEQPTGVYVENRRIKPKIRRRIWRQIRDWATVDSPYPKGIAFTKLDESSAKQCNANTPLIKETT